MLLHVKTLSAFYLSLEADQEHIKGFLAFLEKNAGEFQFTD